MGLLEEMQKAIQRYRDYGFSEEPVVMASPDMAQMLREYGYKGKIKEYRIRGNKYTMPKPKKKRKKK